MVWVPAPRAAHPPGQEGVNFRRIYGRGGGRAPDREQTDNGHARGRDPDAVHLYLREIHLVEEVLDTWVEAGRWWEQENETQTWRIRTRKGGVFEIIQDVGTKQWKLYKVYA